VLILGEFGGIAMQIELTTRALGRNTVESPRKGAKHTKTKEDCITNNLPHSKPQKR